MSYEGIIAICALIAIAAFKIGRSYERWKPLRNSAAAERIRQKYQAHRGSTERV